MGAMLFLFPLLNIPGEALGSVRKEAFFGFQNPERLE
jgi:hypothetical protein